MEEARAERALRAAVLDVVLPGATGLVTGAAVAGLGWLAEEVVAGRIVLALPGAMPALVAPFALLLTRLVTVWVTRTEHPATAELYIESVHRAGSWIPLAQMPGRVLAAMTTVGLGGSQGLESPSALLGASAGQVLGRLWRSLLPGGRLDENARRTLLAAGSSAGIAAVFSSPAVGALYGIEIPWKRDVDAPRLVPCAIAAACSFAVRDALVGARHLVDLQGVPELDARLAAGVLLVALGCGLGARAFAAVDEAIHRVTGRVGPWRRALGAGAALGGLAFAGHALAGVWITAGPGYLASEWVSSARPAPVLLLAALLIRAAGTLVCVLGGGGGGVFTSLACCGVFVGELVAEAVQRTSTRVLPLLGAACFLGAGYRLPLACMLYVAEQSGSTTVSILGLVAVALSQAMMGEASVSSAQLERRT